MVAANRMKPSPSDSSRGLRLPPQIVACLFDLDGVLTPTARLHAAAWKRMFDDVLRARSDGSAAAFVPFDETDDYLRFVDGKPRADGVRSFLAARGIALPEGSPTDSAEAETVHGLGNRKNDLVVALIDEVGVAAYEDAVAFVRAARDVGLACAVVSSSANCRDVLRVAGIERCFDVVVDGVVAAEQHLRGKPAPDTFLAAAAALGVEAAAAAVFEDAEAGVEAGRAGGFGLVVGVDRVGRAAVLRRCGADVVVPDLGALLEAS